jgi:hypothetical protein
MTQEQVIGIVRHSLTFIGGLLTMQGYLDETLFQEISGAIITLAGAIWSIAAKKK